MIMIVRHVHLHIGIAQTGGQVALHIGIAQKVIRWPNIWAGVIQTSARWPYVCMNIAIPIAIVHGARRAEA